MSDNVTPECVEKKTTLISDDNGNPSMMRLCFFIGIFMSACITGVLLYGAKWKTPPVPITITDVSLLLTWIVSSFGSKVFQKYLELKGAGNG